MERIKVNKNDINYFMNLAESERMDICRVFLLERDEDNEFETQFDYEDWELYKANVKYVGNNVFKMLYYIVENNGTNNYYDVELEVIE